MELKDVVNGFLNDHAKVKAFVVGFYAGLTEWKGMDSETLNDPNVVKYPYYARFAYSIATLTRWGIIIAGYNIVT